MLKWEVEKVNKRFHWLICKGQQLVFLVFYNTWLLPIFVVGCQICDKTIDNNKAVRNLFVEISFVSGYSVSMLLGISYKFSSKFEISGLKRTRGPSHGL